MRTASRLFLFRLRRELRRGVLPVLVLEELTSGPTYGYALLARLNGTLGPGAPVGPSTLYPALSRLRGAGLVRAFHGTTSRGPLRKYYEITEEGRALLPILAGLRVTERTPKPRSDRRYRLPGTRNRA